MATAQLLQGCGGAIDGTRVMSFIIMFETYLIRGADAACKDLGWRVDRTADVQKFKIVDTIGRAP